MLKAVGWRDAGGDNNNDHARKTQHNPCLLMWDEISGSDNYVNLITHGKGEI